MLISMHDNPSIIIIIIIVCVNENNELKRAIFFFLLKMHNFVLLFFFNNVMRRGGKCIMLVVWATLSTFLRLISFFCKENYTFFSIKKVLNLNLIFTPC